MNTGELMEMAGVSKKSLGTRINADATADSHFRISKTAATLGNGPFGWAVGTVKEFLSPFAKAEKRGYTIAHHIGEVFGELEEMKQQAVMNRDRLNEAVYRNLLNEALSFQTESQSKITELIESIQKEGWNGTEKSDQLRARVLLLLDAIELAHPAVAFGLASKLVEALKGKPKLVYELTVAQRLAETKKEELHYWALQSAITEWTMQ